MKSIDRCAFAAMIVIAVLAVLSHCTKPEVTIVTIDRNYRPINSITVPADAVYLYDH